MSDFIGGLDILAGGTRKRVDELLLASDEVQFCLQDTDEVTGAERVPRAIGSAMGTVLKLPLRLVFGNRESSVVVPVMVVLSNRLIFIQNERAVQCHFRDVLSIEVKRGRTRSYIFASTPEYRLPDLGRIDTDPDYDWSSSYANWLQVHNTVLEAVQPKLVELRTMVEQSRSSVSTSKVVPSGLSLADEIQKLIVLRGTGGITQAQFDALIDRLSHTV